MDCNILKLEISSIISNAMFHHLSNITFHILQEILQSLFGPLLK